MARYTSIRGWLECDYELIPALKEIAFDNIDNGLEIGTSDSSELYKKGWVFPQEPINWTAYVFFGADIKSQYADFLKDQISRMIQLDNEIEGVFYVDDDDGGKKIIWRVIKSAILEGVRVT